MKYEIGQEITWKSLATGKVRTGYIVSIKENAGSPENNIPPFTRYEVKNQYGDPFTVSKEEIN